MFELRGVRAGYDDIGVFHGADMYIDKGEIVVLTGLNGTGRITTMRTICDIPSSNHDEITYRDEATRSKVSHEIVGRGIVQVPENHDLFIDTTVIDNLLPGAQTGKAKAYREENLSEMLELFPRLAEYKNQCADTMSGGEQQMLASARVLMDGPDLLILDEPSVGLTLHLVQEVFDVIEDIHVQGMVVLAVGQGIQQTLKLVDHDYVMENDRIGMTTDGDQLLEDESVVEAYLGMRDDRRNTCVVRFRP